MFVQFVEKAAEYLVLDVIRDESLGDLWELDHRYKEENKPKIFRLAKTSWNFLLIIKASLAIFLDQQKTRFFEHSEVQDVQKFEMPKPKVEMEALCPEKIRQVKQYCDTRRLYDENLSKKLMKLSPESNLYWIYQVDRIIERCLDRGDKLIDCEAIINSFILSNLIRQIESIPPSSVDLKFFSSLIEQVNLTDEFINRYVGFDPKEYKRQLICGTWSLSVYVISWAPGQESLMHHHGYALDAIKVISGKLTHWQIPLEKNNEAVPFECFRGAKRYEGDSEIFSRGDTILIDRLQGHQLANLSNENLVTLHIRFGPPPEDRHWRSTTDTEMFIWNQAEGCFDFIFPDNNGYASMAS